MKLKFPLRTIALPAVAIAAMNSASAAIILTETFTYADGPIAGPTPVAGSPWVTHSGTTPGQVDVSGGTVVVTGAESEDVNTPFSIPGPYSTGVLSSTFSVTFSALPTGTSTYFAHYKDAANGFTARLFSTVTGAAPGTFRLGISNSTAGAVFSTIDLATATTYQITLNLDLDTNSSSFSIGSGPTVVATDAAVDLAITSFALRQAAGIGTLTADNLVVDYTVPEPAAALLGAVGLLTLARRRR